MAPGDTTVGSTPTPPFPSLSSVRTHRVSFSQESRLAAVLPAGRSTLAIIVSKRAVYLPHASTEGGRRFSLHSRGKKPCNEIREKKIRLPTGFLTESSLITPHIQPTPQ